MSRSFLLATLLFTGPITAGPLPFRATEEHGKSPGLMAHPSAVNGLAFSPDGHTLYSVGDDGTLRIWDVATGRELRSIKAHEGRALSLSLSGDGTRLATGGEDGIVRIWDATMGKPMRELRVRSGEAEGVSLSRDGLRLAVSAGTSNHRFYVAGDRKLFMG